MKVRDQVNDDGVDFVSATGRYVILTAPSSQAISINAGAFSPSSVTIPAGTTVTWTNNSGSNQNVGSTTNPYDYQSGTISPAGTYAHAFVAPGVYNYSSSLGGFSGTVTVTGSANVGTNIRAGVGLHRFSFPDTAGGNGVELVYECEFRDWRVNIKISESGRVTLLPNTCPNPTFFCVSKTSSSGCTPVMGSSGSASLSAPGGFSALGNQLEAAKNGLMFFGTTGQNSSPFFGGTLCVGAPLHRLTPKNTGGAGACSGALNYTLSEMLAQPSGGSLLIAGQTVDIQTWFRDPSDPFTVGLTNGMEFQVCP